MQKTLLKNLDEAEIGDDVIGMRWELKRTQANTVRLWSFGKPVKRVATYVKAKVTGFYSLNGLIEFPESNKTEDFIALLRRIREANEKMVWTISGRIMLRR